MAVKITNKDGLYDVFKNQCPKCGVEFEYSRRDILAHRRWPNGFIYCPKCKNPIGHDNDCFIYNRLEKAEEQKAEQAAKEAEEMKVPSTLTQEQRDQYANQVKGLTTGMVLFLIFGIIFMIGGTLLFIVRENWAYLLGTFIVGIGIAMIVVRAAVFGKQRAKKLREVEKYDLQNK